MAALASFTRSNRGYGQAPIDGTSGIIFILRFHIPQNFIYQDVTYSFYFIYPQILSVFI